MGYRLRVSSEGGDLDSRDRVTQAVEACGLLAGDCGAGVEGGWDAEFFIPHDLTLNLLNLAAAAKDEGAPDKVSVELFYK